MIAAFRTVLAIGLLTVAAGAHDPITTKLTWTREVSRLFLKRCISCHQPGGRAPFPLTTYAEARPWAVAIREEVSKRTMPPWGAVRGFGDFRDDASLTQEEIQVLIDWVNGGAPEGDSQYLPNLPYSTWSPVRAPGNAVPWTGNLEFREATSLLGLRPKGANLTADLQVTLEKPDGTVEPLLWLKDWNPKFPHDFVFRQPHDTPAGSRLRVSGNSTVAWELLTKPRPSTKAGVRSSEASADR